MSHFDGQDRQFAVLNLSDNAVIPDTVPPQCFLGADKPAAQGAGIVVVGQFIF
jgi:hypothetical protein